MNEQKNNGRGIFYGVIGIATLVVAIIGATFAYFTATASVNNQITGNMATITFNLQVTKVTEVDVQKGGLIPMSNSMVEAAVNSAKGACVDDNGNAVCQVYKVTATNTGSASLFLDGYVSLTGGSGEPEDFTTATNETTMRWAQVFVSGDKYTTVGTSTTGASTDAGNVEGIDTAWTTLAAPDDKDDQGAVTATHSHNTGNIKTSFAEVTHTGEISGNNYDIINRNYIRISDHAPGANYTRTADTSSALVFNQYLDAAGGAKPSIDLYFVVWLSETGENQTADSGAPAFDSVDTNENDKIDANEKGVGFFEGNVAFNSAQGSEVTATFSGFVSVRSDQA